MSRRSNIAHSGPRSGPRSRRGIAAGAGTAIASRGVVMIAICTGAVMWGYALINLATRA